MKETVEMIVKALVDDAEAVDVREELGRDGRSVIIEVRVAPDDMGKLIGRQGRTVRALRSRLYELELERRQAETAALEANKADISFGSQIRNYVLAPYRLVKDARTKLERGDVDAVLAGDLDDFIKAYLLSRRAA